MDTTFIRKNLKIMSEKTIKEYILDSGLQLKLIDKSYRYFGEYFFIEIHIYSEIPSRLLDKSLLPPELLPLIPEKLIFTKILSKKAVHESKLASEKRLLIENFEENGLAYLKSKNFINKFYLKELLKIKRKREIEDLRNKLSEGENPSTF